MTTTNISQTDMAARLQAGDAQALLPDGVPGPVRLDDQWWAIEQDAEDYTPITDSADVARLAEYARKLADGSEAARLARVPDDDGGTQR